MKRSRDYDADTGDDDLLPVRPAKRFSMMDNTPQQWKEERRHILRLSKQKLRKLDNPLRDLQKSVLLNNTSRRMRRELQEHGGSKYRGYKRNHASVPYQTLHHPNAWESEAVAQPVTPRPEEGESGPSARTDARESAQSGESRSLDIEDSVVMDTTTSKDSYLGQCQKLNSCDNQTSSADECQDLISSDSQNLYDCSTCERTAAETRHTALETSSHFRSHIPERIAHCGSAGVALGECDSGNTRAESECTGSSSTHKGGLTDRQSPANECNYTPLGAYSQYTPNVDISTQNTDFCYANSDVYTSYNLLYKHYCTYSGYAHSLHNPFGLHNQFLFSLTELLRNNNCSYQAMDSNTGDRINPVHTLYGQCNAFDSPTCVESESEETYVDILT